MPEPLTNHLAEEEMMENRGKSNKSEHEQEGMSYDGAFLKARV